MSSLNLPRPLIVSIFVSLAIILFAVFSSPSNSSAVSSTANLSINKTSFVVGDNWTLNITTDPPLANQVVTLCGTKSPGPLGCVPAATMGYPATTDTFGNWSATKVHDKTVIGSWDMYAEIGTPVIYAISNHISFTVAEESISCQLSVSKTDICVGDTTSWNITSTPNGLPASWFGSKNGTADANGVPAGVSNTPEVYGPYNCSTIGEYTRYAQVSSNTQQCTTNPVNVTVRDCTGVCNPNNPSSTPDPNNQSQPIPELAPPACSDANPSFASVCQSNEPTSRISTPQVNSDKTTSFTVYVKPPESMGTNIIWSKGYVWRQDQSKWEQFSLNGPTYTDYPCADLANGCWLTNNASTELTLPPSAARDGTFLISVWYYFLNNGQWQTASCSTNQCWTIIPALDWQSVLEQIKQTSSIPDAINIARSAGLTVNEYFNADILAVEIKHPLTGEMLAVMTEQEAKIRGNTTGAAAICKVKSGATGNLLVFSDGRNYGIDGNYDLYISTDDLSGFTDSAYKEKADAAIKAAIKTYDDVPGIPHSSGSSHNTISITWANMDTEGLNDASDIQAVAVARSFEMADGSFSNTCVIVVNKVASEIGLDIKDLSTGLMSIIIQHEIGHCFGLAHDNLSSGIKNIMFNSIDDLINLKLDYDHLSDGEKKRINEMSDFSEVANTFNLKADPVTPAIQNLLQKVNGNELIDVECPNVCNEEECLGRLCGDGQHYDINTTRCLDTAVGSNEPPPKDGNPPGSYITPPSLLPKGCQDMNRDSEGFLYCTLPGGTDCNCSRFPIECTDNNGYPTSVPADACLYSGGGGGMWGGSGGWWGDSCNGGITDTFQSDCFWDYLPFPTPT